MLEKASITVLKNKPSGKMVLMNGKMVKRTLSKDKSKDWHKKIALVRGAAWRKKLSLGKIDAQRNPSLLRIARLDKGLGQYELSRKLKITEATYGGIERSFRTVKKELALEIAKMLGKSLASLFKIEDKKYLAIKK